MKVEALARKAFDTSGPFCCTEAAWAVAQAMGGEVWGYFLEDPEDRSLLGWASGGHDFAVVRYGGRGWVVDLWAAEYENAPAVVHLKQAERGRRGYLSSHHWEIVRARFPELPCPGGNAMSPSRDGGLGDSPCPDGRDGV